ncbi:MAG: tetratricopeptide repeat protein [Deltaproteobacteria bacterium]|nr:tetratricopeptide repeat protein [Deltaproteobacteria bacterium]
MAQYHRFSTTDHGELSVGGRIERTLHWTIGHWKPLVVIAAGCVLTAGLFTWHQSSQSRRAAEASYALYQALHPAPVTAHTPPPATADEHKTSATPEAPATPSPEPAPDLLALQGVIHQYDGTLYADLARLHVARVALTMNDRDRVRELLTPLAEEARLPLLQAAALQTLGITYELEAAWGTAATHYEKILRLRGAGMSYPRALSNAVRCHLHTGNRTAAEAVLNQPPPVDADETYPKVQEQERLWLTIDTAS